MCLDKYYNMTHWPTKENSSFQYKPLLTNRDISSLYKVMPSAWGSLQNITISQYEVHQISLSFGQTLSEIIRIIWWFLFLPNKFYFIEYESDFEKKKWFHKLFTKMNWFIKSMILDVKRWTVKDYQMSQLYSFHLKQEHFRLSFS
jgi:hypothetical protein